MQENKSGCFFWTQYEVDYNDWTWYVSNYFYRRIRPEGLLRDAKYDQLLAIIKFLVYNTAREVTLWAMFLKYRLFYTSDQSHLNFDHFPDFWIFYNHIVSVFVARCYASAAYAIKRCPSMIRLCVFVCPSVCHVRALCRNEYSYPQTFFSIG